MHGSALLMLLARNSPKKYVGTMPGTLAYPAHLAAGPAEQAAGSAAVCQPWQRLSSGFLSCRYAAVSPLPTTAPLSSAALGQRGDTTGPRLAKAPAAHL